MGDYSCTVWNQTKAEIEWWERPSSSQSWYMMLQWVLCSILLIRMCFLSQSRLTLQFLFAFVYVYVYAYVDVDVYAIPVLISSCCVVLCLASCKGPGQPPNGSIRFSQVS
ncbi:hypothetical protein BDW67DRAFT_163206 [Aspergillus spinulosporus]